MKSALTFSIFDGGVELLFLLVDVFHAVFFYVVWSVGIGLGDFFRFHGSFGFVETVLVGGCGVD
jgi:hypothetical protein